MTASFTLAAPDVPVWLFLVFFAAGVVLQAAGFALAKKGLLLLGGALAVCAGLVDRDPTLVVGQLALTAGCLLLLRERWARAARAGRDGNDAR